MITVKWLSLLLILFTLSIKFSESQELFIQNNNVNLKKGDIFDISIMVDNVQAISGYQYGITFNNNIIECIGVEQGGFFQNNTQSPIYWNNPIYSQYVSNVEDVSCIQEFNNPGVTGQGELLMLTFEAKNYGNVLITFNHVIFVNSNGNPVNLNYSNELIEIENDIFSGLSNGIVSPPTGNNSTNFTFSITFSAEQAPQYVKLKGSWGDENMIAGSGNYPDGVQFTANKTFSNPGVYTYYFEAKTANNELIHWPETGSLTLNVTQSAAGWEMDVTDLTASPTYLINGGNFTTTGTAHNNSNTPDKIYYNVPYKFELFSPTGSLIDSEQGIIASLQQLVSVPITKTLTTGTTIGAYSLIFSVYPTLDNNLANNTMSKIIIVGQAGPSHQFYISPAEGSVLLGEPPTYDQCHNFPPVPNDDEYCVTNINSNNITIQQNSGSNKTINLYDFREFNSGQVALILETLQNYGTEWAMIGFGIQNTDFITFEQTEVACFQGDVVVFEANCTSPIFTNDDPTIYKNTYIDDWFDDVDLANGNHTAYYQFAVPDNATFGTHDFFIGCNLTGANESFIRELKINVLAPLPQITSLSSYNFSADDQITITGSNLYPQGAIQYNNVTTTGNIISWTNSQIVCIVPENITPGLLKVINSNGWSNGLVFSVISSTGNPIVIQPIPDQSMSYGSTMIVANLNNTFWDPNNDQLTYNVNISSPHITYEINNGELSLTTDNLAQGINQIDVSATDLDNVTITDNFELSVNSNPPVANFSAVNTNINVGQSVIFTNLSSSNATSWQWTFEGGTPETSTLENPVVTYNTAGIFDVTLTVSNGVNISDPFTELDYITVQQVALGGLVAYYPFNGNPNDESGNNNHGTLYGPTSTIDRFNNANSAYSFDGSNDYIWLGGTDMLKTYNGFTISGWFQTSSNAPFQDIYRWRLNGNCLQIKNGLISAFYYTQNNSYSISSQLIYNDGNFHFAVFTWQKVESIAEMKLYVDGQLVANQTTNYPDIYFGSGGAAIGRDGNFNGDYFNGKIDDIRIFNRALTSQEILYLYNYPPVNILITDPNNVNITWQKGYAKTISWNDNINENVKIELFKGGALYALLSSGTFSNGSFNWYVSWDFENGNDYKIKITSTLDANIYDFSDNNFTISTPYVTVTSPDAGNNWQVGSNKLITWNYNITETIKIRLYQAGNFIRTIKSSTECDGQYQWSVPDDLPDGNDYQVKISSTTNTNVYNYSDNFTLSLPNTILDLKAFFEGPFDATEMLPWIDYLMPSEQPFNFAPWNYTGTESFTVLPSTGVIDWILIELRATPGDASTATPDKMIARQAGFILSDGSIVGLDGVSNLEFENTTNENLFAIIWHRNHMGIMSSIPLIRSGGIYHYDFTTSENQVYGGSLGSKQLVIGIWGMLSGDGNSDGQINNKDKNDVWKPQNGLSGYKQGDFNMDGQVDSSDKTSYWQPNSGKGSQVPQ